MVGLNIAHLFFGLIKQWKKKMKKKKHKKVILFYRPNKKYGFLSNFYKSQLQYRDRLWKTSEHAYQAMKSFSMYDWLWIGNAKTAKKAKERGNKLELRTDWEEVKYNIMVEILKAKFSQNPTILRMLLDTGDAELMENSPYDYVWGIGRDFTGQNLLGKALMEVRGYFVDKI